MRFSNKNGVKLILLVVLVNVLLLIFTFNQGLARPNDNYEEFEDCHERGDYRIYSNNSREIVVEKNEVFNLIIEGVGPEVILVFNILSEDNRHFISTPSEDIDDESVHDQEPAKNHVLVNYSLTAPEEIGTYIILFYVRSPPRYILSQPYIDFLVFEIIVEEPAFRVPSLLDILFTLLDHYNIYLGVGAISCLLVATILSEKDYRKYNKVHGYLNAIALTLTTINTILIVPETFNLIISWVNGVLIDWWHLIHLMLGIIGFIACIYGAFTGLSGIKHKIPGYVALLSWGFNFIFGLIYWGIGLI